MTDWTLVGFTGHRKLSHPQAVSHAIRETLAGLEERHSPLAVVSSAASGADTLFLEAARERDLPSFLVLPFAEQRFREDFEPANWQRIPPLIEHALHVEVVGDTESANEAYLESGIQVVEQVDVLLAVWDGQPAQGTGGTADVVRYARSLGKPVVIIDPVTGQVTEEGTDTLPRAAAPAAKDLRRSVSDRYEELNRRAIKEGPRARHIVLQIILMHLVAAGVGLLPAVLGWHDFRLQLALGIEVALLGWALVLGFLHRHPHHEWIRTRSEAELCRAFLAMWDLPRSVGSLPRLVYPWSQKLYRNLRIAWYLDRSISPELPEACRLYRERRVMDQLNYFRSHCANAERRVGRLRAAAQFATFAALATCIVALLLSILTHSEPHGLFVAMKLSALLLPIVNAAALSIAVANDLGRRAVRYRQMADTLESMATRLETVGTWPGLWRVVTETEELLLRETGEWQAMTLFTGESH